MDVIHNMQPALIIVGGYLGAGKTTRLLDAAARLRTRGHEVAIITNVAHLKAFAQADTGYVKASVLPSSRGAAQVQVAVPAKVEARNGEAVIRFERPVQLDNGQKFSGILE